ncbi:MAG: LysM peptidoglycan-binding domain-containing protein [Gammaproteobacteria bacterium]|nr:LysM peptidoglycan-binding domain-containing protein [Gammaproteobacteria bacterium]
MARTWFVMVAALLAAGVANAAELRPDAPDRYTVVKGDTLWGISERFLNDPWAWPKVWKANPQIENPNLIYPGDVVVLDTDANGNPSLRVLRRERPTVKLSPTAYSEALEGAVTTIPPEAIQPFLAEARVLPVAQLRAAGYVAQGVKDALVLGKYSRFYARGLEPGAARGTQYQVFRLGEAIIDPETSELLGHEGIYLGEASLLQGGETAKLRVISSRQEILPGDRLLPASGEVVIPRYFPHAPDKPLRGRVLRVQGGVREAGKGSILLINLGSREGIEQAHVLRIHRSPGRRLDPVTRATYFPPNEPTGMLLVFAVFDKTSYGLVMRSSGAVVVGDTVTTP